MPDEAPPSGGTFPRKDTRVSELRMAAFGAIAVAFGLAGFIVGREIGLSATAQEREQSRRQLEVVLTRLADVRVSVPGSSGSSGFSAPVAAPAGVKLLDFLTGQAAAAINEARQEAAKMAGDTARKVGETVDIPRAALKKFLDQFAAKAGDKSAEHLLDGFKELVSMGVGVAAGQDIRGETDTTRREIEGMVKGGGAGIPRLVEQVLFDTDKAVVTRSGYDALERVRAFAKAHPKTVILLSGHADTAGSTTHNKGLAHRRSAAVRQSLISSGEIPPNRVFSADAEAPWLRVLTAANTREPLNRAVVIEVR